MSSGVRAVTAALIATAATVLAAGCGDETAEVGPFYTRNLLEPGDLDEALTAAATVGDDFLQKQATGSVQPEKWTHGTSAQRQKWLTTGYDKGVPSACDTFAASNP